jgi:hypothetical protein
MTVSKYEIDNEKNKLVRSPDRSNIFFELLKEDSIDNSPPFNENLKKVIYPLALKNADWKLIIPLAVTRNEHIRCVVLKDTDVIGEIKIVWKWSATAYTNEETYSIASTRIVGGRKNGYKETRDPKKAIKIATEFFFEKSNLERYIKATQILETAVSNYIWKKQRALIDMYTSSQHAVVTYIEKVNEVGSGTPVEMPSFFTTMVEANREKIRAEAITQGGGLYVYVVGDGSYVIGDPNTSAAPMTWRRQDISEDLMTKITMLKVAPDKAAVDDVGYRYDESSFFVKKS